MYADFFGLRELPFNNTPDPRFFYSTPDHDEALASLIYAVQERKGFVLLTGEVGAGKTLVSRMMLRHFGDRIHFANIHHAVRGADELMESVAQEFELETGPETSATQRVRALHDFLLEQFSANRPAVLVLDEAQNLSIDAFEQLRMIGNLEADDAKLLQVVIVGQPELQGLFASKELRQLRQRIFRGFHLPSLNRQTTQAYVVHRLRVAGGAGPGPFDASAFDAVFRHSRGLPRLINGICDNCLLSGYSADRRRIDGGFVESVIGQMMTLGRDAVGTAAREADDTFERRQAQTESQRPKPEAAVVPTFENRTSVVLRNSPMPLSGPYEALARRAAQIEARLRGLAEPAGRSSTAVTKPRALSPRSIPARELGLDAARPPAGLPRPAAMPLNGRLDELCHRLTRVVRDVRRLVTTIDTVEPLVSDSNRPGFLAAQPQRFR
jgi:general secretion pathway protein A